MQFELTVSMMCANYGHLEQEVKDLEEGGIDIVSGSDEAGCAEVYSGDRSVLFWGNPNGIKFLL